VGRTTVTEPQSGFSGCTTFYQGSVATLMRSVNIGNTVRLDSGDKCTLQLFSDNQCKNYVMGIGPITGPNGGCINTTNSQGKAQAVIAGKMVCTK
jgi:hypothetical protein